MSLVVAVVRHDDAHEGHEECLAVETTLPVPLEVLPQEVSDGLVDRLALSVRTALNE